MRAELSGSLFLCRYEILPMSAMTWMVDRSMLMELRTSVSITGTSWVPEGWHGLPGLGQGGVLCRAPRAPRLGQGRALC